MVSTARKSQWVLDALEDGSKTHEELCDELDMDWDDLQPIIQRLRNDGRIVNTVDREYMKV